MATADCIREKHTACKYRDNFLCVHFVLMITVKEEFVGSICVLMYSMSLNYGDCDKTLSKIL